MSWYLRALKKYAVFTGRAPRQEYWYFVLFNFLIALLFIFGAMAAASLRSHRGVVTLLALYVLYLIALVIPSLAVSVRRLHDTNHSGWWMFIGLVPLIGEIVLIILHVRDSQPADNRYGSYPKAGPGALT